jgi:pimeloyl-ACP methyl ester carboxylesterase
MDRKTISIPTLFIQANYDSVLQPSMAMGMEKYLTNLSRGEVNSSHWALTQKPEEVNVVVKSWLEKVGFGAKSSL